ncbi:hypothetical protein MKW94_002574, partial [Papaver nudicaule]|nr:hypothetical protein [Papaver nudicaule]
RTCSHFTPKRSIDVLRDVHAAKEQGRPYVITFVGVNGVGKSTNLAKIAYWLQQHNISVMMAACDTFRSGAVEQLRTHARRLQIPIFEKGYEKDPAVVAKEAILDASRNGSDVVLVDTAGRMQDNEPLMRGRKQLVEWSPSLEYENDFCVPYSESPISLCMENCERYLNQVSCL